MDQKNLYHSFENCFLAHADAAAFEAADGAVLLTYAELHALVCRYANALESIGLKEGDRVTAQLQKTLSAVVLYLAVMKAGAVYNPLNSAYTPSEVEYFIADATPRLLITSTEKSLSLSSVADRHGVRLKTLDGGNKGSLAAIAATCSGDHVTSLRRGGDLAGLLYTSGTTGRPKGAMLTHANLESNARTLHRLWGFEPGDVLLHALPIFHVHGLYVALNTSLLNASRIIWLDHFDAAEVLRLLPRATVFMGVPTFYTRLLDHRDLTPKACASLRLLISGSAPLLSETHAQVLHRTGHSILERYGMTETGMIASNPLHGERIPGTVGYPLPDVELRIVGEDGSEQPRNGPGVIEVRGPNVFGGYWRREQEHSDDFRPDGFFITGDIGVLDDAGRLSILGRAKDLIITGGLNVYPREVEQALDGLPGIVESAVIAVPHKDYGEAVLAIATASGQAPDERRILDLLRTNLAGFKLPKRIIFLDELPRNAMGKVQKAELRRRFAQIFIDQP